MKGTILYEDNEFFVDFDVCPDIKYVRRTGDYEMTDAEVGDWDIGIYNIMHLPSGTSWWWSEQMEAEIKPALLKYWKENYDPTPWE